MDEYTARQKFEDDRQKAQSHWDQWLPLANRDLQFSLGKQYTQEQLDYLAARGRQAFVFNKIKRIVKLVTGYERKTRLALTVKPVEGEDDPTAEQLSAILLHLMQKRGGYRCCSRAFEGMLKTGINYVGLSLDYRKDEQNGDVCFRRVPHNKILIDPMFTELDLSDCDYILRGEWFSAETIKGMLPKSLSAQVAEALEYGKTPALASSAFGLPPSGMETKDFSFWEEHWFRDTRTVESILNPQTMKVEPFKGDANMKKQLEIMGIKIISKSVSTVKLNIFVNEKLVYSGRDPLEIDDYPYVPIIAEFDPECDDAEIRLQSFVRPLIDPQISINKRHSQLADMIEKQINSGWMAPIDSVPIKESLYRNGQGEVVWWDPTKAQGNKPEKIAAYDIPPGYLAFAEKMDQDLDQIAGANQELMGQVDNDVDVAGILAKLRQGQGLTILQDLFDNYRDSKAILGAKLIKVIQRNYSPSKVQRLINQQPTQAFYLDDLAENDVIPEEGVLSSSQREIAFTQQLSLKRMGAPIPWSSILELATVAKKDVLMRHVKAEEDAAAQQAQLATQNANVMAELAKGQTASAIAGAQAKTAQVQQNIEEAKLAMVKSAKEISGMELAQVQQALEVLQVLVGGMMGKSAQPVPQAPMMPEPQPMPQPQSQMMMPQGGM